MPTTPKERKVYHIDARDQILGRLATEIANILRGKGKTEFVPYLDMGDCVVVTHSRDLRLTGRKMEQKEYISHTGYPGGLRRQPIKDLMTKDPTEVLRRAVYGMLPKNRLRQQWMKRLKIYADEER